MSNIRNEVEELDATEGELKILRTKMKKLNTRKKQIHENIATFMEERDEVGLKYNGKIIMINPSKGRKPKKQKDKEKDCKSLIEQYGIDDVDDFYEDLISTMRGESYTRNTIKIKKL